MSLGRPTGIVAVDTGAGPPSGLPLLGGGPLDLAQAAVHRVAVHLGVGDEHDRVELTLWRGSSLADLEPGTRLAIALGLDDEPVDVLAADVVRIDRRPDRIDVSALAPSHALSSISFARTYQEVSIADVVNDILDEGDVAGDEIDGHDTLPTFYVEGRLSAWENLRRLARRVGALITNNPVGELRFTPAPGVSSGGLGGAVGGAVAATASAVGLGPSAELRTGADLLDWQLGPRRPAPRQTPEVVSVGGGSTLGSSRAHHLVKEPDTGPGPTRIESAFRDDAGAGRVGSAMVAGAARATSGGRLDVVGDPGLRAGTVVESDGQSWHVVRVRHLIDDRAGYRCQLVVEAAS